MARKKKKRLKSLNQAAVGEEPTWDDVSADEFPYKKVKAYNWYNYMYNQPKAKKFLISHFKTDKEKIDVIRKSFDYNISTTAGWLARMADLGAPLTEKELNFMENHIKELASLRVEGEGYKTPTNKKSVHQLTKEKVQEQISILEGCLDDYILSDYKKMPDFYKILQKQGVKGKHAQAIIQHYMKTEIELSDALSKKKIEGYDTYKKTELKKILKFYQELIKNCEIISDNASKQRKPRKTKKRKINKAKLVKKVNYLKEFPDMKLVSENPEKIIGAQVAFLYNTKTGELSYYKSCTTDGLTIKGTTIKEFNKFSAVKRIGKKQDIISEILKNTKTKSIKHFEDINRKINTCSGRINKHTIILKVY